MEDRRKQREPDDTEGYLHQLPALALLNRLPIAMLGVGSHGDIVYANPACADLLGYADAESVTRLDLPKLLTGHDALAPADCLDVLRNTDSIVEWNHDHGYVGKTMLSPPLLMRATDPLLLVGITDVTAWHWESDRL